MPKITRIILALTEPFGPAKPTSKDMITAMSRTHIHILTARFPVMLDLIEGTLDRLQSYYNHLEATPFHIDRLCHAILQRRCEFIAQQAPVCE